MVDLKNINPNKELLHTQHKYFIRNMHIFTSLSLCMHIYIQIHICTHVYLKLKYNGTNQKELIYAKYSISYSFYGLSSTSEITTFVIF